MNKVIALAKADILITLRRSEAIVLNVIVPILVLVGLSHSSSSVDHVISFSYLQVVLATSMVSLGISTGFDRRFRVLVRLGTTPLGRKGLIYSKILSLLVVQTMQLILLSLVALLLGWTPRWQWILSFPLCWISSCAFAGIALLIAGRLKAEANLGLQNLVYIVMMSVGALGFMQLNKQSEITKLIIMIVPSSALHVLLRYLSGVGSFSFLAFCSLLFWSIILPLLAAKTFSFDEG